MHDVVLGTCRGLTAASCVQDTRDVVRPEQCAFQAAEVGNPLTAECM
jgi:hypothetical protein